MHGSTIVRTFPISFWIGNANAFYNGGMLDPCNTDNCTVEDNVIYTRFILSNENEIQKVNGHHFCVQLQTMIEEDFRDDHLKSIANANSEILSEKCTKEKCERRTIFDFNIAMYPCSKVKLITKNDRKIYFIIEDVNYSIKNEIELYLQPFRTNTYESLMTCGKLYCLKYLNKINTPVCRDDCEGFDVIQGDLYKNSIDTKSPFQHVLLENNPSRMFQLYNTRFKFDCNTYKSDCYSFSDNVFSFTNREGLEMTFLEQGINYWMFVLVKVNGEVINLKMDLLFGKMNQKYDLFENEVPIVNDDYKITYEIKKKNQKEKLANYILFGFKETMIGKYAETAYEVKTKNDLVEKVNLYCINGFQQKGISDACSFSKSSYMLSMDQNFDEINSHFGKIFAKIDVNKETNFKFQITDIEAENIELVGKKTVEKIKTISKLKVPQDNKGEIKKFSFNLYKHKLTYGNLKIKFENKDDIITPNDYGAKTNIKIETCEGTVGTIAGMVVNVTRTDELEEYSYFECKFGFLKLDCGFVVLKPSALYQSFHLTFPLIISKNTKITLVQTYPILKDKNEIEINCKILQQNFTFDQIGSHLKEGTITEHDDGFGNFLFGLKRNVLHTTSALLDYFSSFNFLTKLKFSFFFFL